MVSILTLRHYPEDPTSNPFASCHKEYCQTSGTFVPPFKLGAFQAICASGERKQSLHPASPACNPFLGLLKTPSCISIIGFQKMQKELRQRYTEPHTVKLHVEVSHLTSDWAKCPTHVTRCAWELLLPRDPLAHSTSLPPCPAPTSA